uniref:Antitoxin HicB n=1 Tax=Candidatus Kentrum sp. LPFa TaxID=2126335 RepID=A0A450VZU4_9GAMM|nr:MAG: antitoxin HicB [Candidatus Kentron sp. LPFa]VFK26605.1 MAG: antitoxin HicB [Candidatus Kentron sp. LPFa]
MNIQYPAVFEPQEPSGFFVRFVDIPEAITQGEEPSECEYNGAEVLSLILDEYFETGREIPMPSQGIENAHYIAPDAKIQAALLNPAQYALNVPWRSWPKRCRSHGLLFGGWKALITDHRSSFWTRSLHETN